jgi:hypothetical protein
MSYVEQFEFSAIAKKRLLLTIVVGVVLFLIGVLGLSSGSTLFDPASASDDHGHHSSVSGAKLANAEHEGHNHGEGAAESHDKASHTDAAHGDAKATAEHGEHGGHGHGHAYSWTKRVFMVLWHNNIYFIGLSVIGLFFYSVQLVAWAGWSALLKRVFLAQGAFIPVAGVILIILYFAIGHDVFHWMDTSLFDPKSPNYDPIIASKDWYLSFSFVLARAVIFIGGWVAFWYFLRQQAQLQDQTNNLLHHYRAINIAGGFIVFFGVSSSMSAWDWIMSIDTHWFSTMFGWYVFASWFVAGLATMTLIIIELKNAGYLQKVNDNHIHDMGKFVFAFSIFWTYVWFAQFILYWYANIPEEIVWFNERMFFNRGTYAPLFVINLIMNFVFPFFFLMTRDAKRQRVWLKIACIVIIIGHWFDTYLMVMPGTLKEHGGLNFGTFFLELGVALVYIGAFGFVVLRSLSKLPLIAKNHPMLEESIHHHI